MSETNAAPGRKRRRRIVARWLAVLLTPIVALALWAAYVLGTDNFHPIIAGEAYRSGQMSSNELVRCLQRHGIRSVINLRGENPKQTWYQEEVGAARALGVMHRDLALSSRRTVTPQQADGLMALYKELPKPVLLHCDGGADRVAFASALYATQVARWPEARAERQFSMWYGHLPGIWREKGRLRESFRNHNRRVWLAAQHRS